MEVKFKKLHPNARMPTYSTDGAGCFDLYAVTDANIGVCPYQSEKVGTGIAVEVPEGHVMLIHSRSGHGWKNGVRLANCTGVIDSDYRGEIMAKLHNDSEEMFIFAHGDRIAQAMIIPVERVTFIEVEELSSTERGENGFGSTGK